MQNVALAGFFTLTCCVILFVRMIPLDLLPGSVPPPDMIFALTIALLLRRPKALPMGLIVVVFLSRDILLSAPLGLWTAVALAVTEYVRRTRANLKDMLFLAEWAWFAGLYTSAILIFYCAEILLFIPRDPLAMILPMILLTIVAYPFAILFVKFALRVDKPDHDGAGGFGSAW